jgi:hypothetical protein
VKGTWLTRWSVVVPRLYVRGAAREKDAVQSAEQVIQAQLLGEGRNDQRKRVRRFQHGTGVLFPDHVKRVRADHTAIGGNTNERASGCHDGRPGAFSILNSLAQRILQISLY